MSDQQVTKVKLSKYNDEAQVMTSTAPPGYVVVGFYDARHEPTHPASMTESEWDAFVAAGDRALGRKPARDFPPGPRALTRPTTDAEIVTWMADLYREDTPIAAALDRAAVALGRSDGAPKEG